MVAAMMLTMLLLVTILRLAKQVLVVVGLQVHLLAATRAARLTLN